MEIKATDLRHLQIGDRVTRYLSSSAIPLPMIVVRKEAGIITCGPAEDPRVIKDRIVTIARLMGQSEELIKDLESDPLLPTWDFSELTGFEIDEAFGWNGIDKTGSWICEKQ